MLQYYFGKGKGKTSAAVGACLRAAGNGISCAVIQFFKNGTSGETEPLRQLGIPVLACDFHGTRFFRDMNAEEQAAVIRCHNENLRKVLAENYRFLVLDELGDAVSRNAVDPGLVAELLSRRDCELIVTGHAETPFFSERADYITEFRCIRHPYQNGVKARKGIEY